VDSLPLARFGRISQDFVFGIWFLMVECRLNEQEVALKAFKHKKHANVYKPKNEGLKTHFRKFFLFEFKQ
jgi:hypothetical protein